MAEQAGERVALSDAQRQIWIADAATANPTSHVIAAHLRVDGPLDVAALDRALRRVVDRHAILRTRVDVVGADLVGFVDSSSAFSLRIEDLPDACDDTLVASAERHAREPLDLAASLPLRACVFRRSPDVALLALAIHHIAFDGGSFAVLYRDLAAYYTEEIGRGRPTLPAMPRQYRELQPDVPGEAAREEELAWWRTMLAGRPRCELPGDHPRPARRRGHGAMIRQPLDAGLAQRLDGLARAQYVTRHMLIATVALLLLGERCGQDEVCIGTMYSTRTTAEMRQVIGPYVNLTALPFEIDRGTSFAETLDQAAERMAAVLDARAVSFAQVRKAAGEERDLSRTPVFGVMLDVAMPHEVLELAGCRVSALPEPCLGSKFDLTITVDLDEAAPGLGLWWDPALFERDTIAAVGQHLAAMLRSAPDLLSEPVQKLMERKAGQG